MKYAILAAVMLMGCQEEKEWCINQNKAHEYFIECLKAVPVGPTTVEHNDWGKVVSECADAATDQARYYGYEP